MSRINTNVTSILAQRVLNQQQMSLQSTMEKLSTGLQINSAADNPAGLIASQSLQSEETSINAAIGNAQRADQVSNIAEGGLQEISSMLLNLQNLVSQSANTSGLSADEKNANQLQVDSILQSIDRIASTTSFQGAKLLNGTFDFNVTSQSSLVSDFQINAAKLAYNTPRAVQVVVTASAQHGSMFLSLGGTGLDLASAGARFQFELGGAAGSQAFTFASGTSLASIASAVNTFRGVTGVSGVASGNYLHFDSTTFGSSQFVSFKLDNAGGQTGGLHLASGTNENALKATGGTTAFASMTNPIRATGQDVGAIINGIAATSDGTTANINTDFLDLSLNLTNSGAQTLQTINAFSITGGGAQFNLGPQVDMLNKVSIGIGNVATRNLGSNSLGYLSSLASGQSNNMVSGDMSTAQDIVNAAISQVSNLRGRIGAFQSNVIQPTINSLGVNLENTTAANSAITDTDFASATSDLTRSQILVQAATQVLSIANSQPQSVLKLLGG